MPHVRASITNVWVDVLYIRHDVNLYGRLIDVVIIIIIIIIINNKDFY